MKVIVVELLGDDDPVLFSPGSRLAIHLARLPSLADWRAAAEPLGVSFELVSGDALGSGSHSVTAEDAVSRVTLTLEISPFTDYPADEVNSAAELVVYEKTRWAVHIRPPSDAPDLLPTALGISLAASGEGVCYHADMDRAVFGTDVRAMLDDLRSYSESLDHSD